MGRLREREKRKKRARRLRIQKAATVALGVLVLALGWKVVTLAIHILPESPDGEIRTSESGQTESTEADSVETGTQEKIRMERASSSDVSEDILLVNKENPLPDTYRPELVKLRSYGVEVAQEMYEDLTDMLNDGEAEGLVFWVASGYRSMERQRELLDEDIEALMRRGSSPSEAYEEVVQETMPVGCSEHATGLAVDIVAKDYQILDEKQERTEEIQWLQENCSRYGFILRYPKGKEDITKVSYESWHFRYVGKAAAEEIMESGLTLEEYLEGKA